MYSFIRSCVVLLPLCAVAFCGCGPLSHPLEGKEAPPLELPLLGGGSMNLADHAGKDVVILDFWAAWCGPCRVTMPVINRIAEEYADRGVVLYAVNEGDHADAARRFISEAKLSCAVAMDTNLAAGHSYGAEFIPLTIIIGKSGRVELAHVGGDYQLEGLVRSHLDRLTGAGSGSPDGS